MGGVFLTPLAMNDVTAAEEILSTMLHHLGYDCDVWEVESSDGGPPGLEVTLGDDKEADALLGRDGDRLEDLQFLVNKLLRQRHPGSARVRLDVNGYRARKDDVFLEEVRRQADLVREGGRAVKLEPMNSYQRRLVHHLFRDDPEVETWAPEDESRMKRITLLPRGGV